MPLTQSKAKKIKLTQREAILSRDLGRERILAARKKRGGDIASQLKRRIKRLRG